MLLRCCWLVCKPHFNICINFSEQSSSKSEHEIKDGNLCRLPFRRSLMTWEEFLRDHALYIIWSRPNLQYEPRREPGEEDTSSNSHQSSTPATERASTASSGDQLTENWRLIDNYLIECLLNIQCWVQTWLVDPYIPETTVYYNTFQNFKRCLPRTETNIGFQTHRDKTGAPDVFTWTPGSFFTFTKTFRLQIFCHRMC